MLSEKELKRRSCERSRIWYHSHRKQARANNERWKVAHPGYSTRAGRKWRKAHPRRVKAMNKAYRLANKDKIRKTQKMWARKHRTQKRAQLLASQGGRCAICRRNAPKDRTWHLDHDHRTGHIRGVLCKTCNTGLGHFQDRVKYLRAAIQYLLKARRIYIYIYI